MCNIVDDASVSVDFDVRISGRRNGSLGEYRGHRRPDSTVPLATATLPPVANTSDCRAPGPSSPLRVERCRSELAAADARQAVPSDWRKPQRRTDGCVCRSDASVEWMAARGGRQARAFDLSGD